LRSIPLGNDLVDLDFDVQALLMDLFQLLVDEFLDVTLTHIPINLFL